MKTTLKIIGLLFVLVLSFNVASCENSEQTNLWDNAVYNQDTTLGNGQKTLFIEVKTEEKSITFEIKTDKTIVGEALLENKLIEGEEGAYGLYVKKVNGIEANYEKDQSYWSFSRNGEYMPTGVDSTEFKDKDKFQLVYTK